MFLDASQTSGHSHWFTITDTRCSGRAHTRSNTNSDIPTIEYSPRLLLYPDVVRCQDISLCLQSETEVGHVLVCRGVSLMASSSPRSSFQLADIGVSIAAYTGALVRQERFWKWHCSSTDRVDKLDGAVLVGAI